MDRSGASDTHECRCPPVNLPVTGGSRPMTAPDLRALLSERRLRVRVAGGGVATLSFHGDGRVAGEFPDGTRDRGVWWLEEDRYCIDWKRGPKGSCTLVYRDGETLILRDPAGATRGTVDASASMADRRPDP